MATAAKPLELLDYLMVHEAMGSDPTLLDAVTPSIESAIVRSKIKLQTVLDSSVRPLSNVDIFRVDQTLMPLNGLYLLRLKNGLVRQDQAGLPTVEWATEVDGEFEVVDNSEIDYIKGFAKVPLWTPQGRFSSLSFYRSQARPVYPIYVRVNYASGLIDRVDDPEDYEALKQAMLCFVPMFLMSTADAQQASPRAMYAIQAKAQAQAAAADDMLREYIRTLSPNVRPFRHTQTVLMV